MHRAAGEQVPVDCADLYLTLIRKCILNTIYEDRPMDPWSGGDFSAENRNRGLDWPSVAHSMIGNQRMLNIQTLAEIVIREGIPGDFIEAGVWRGGACIFMRAILKAHGQQNRLVWVADSFAGLPEPDADKYPADSGDQHHTYRDLAVSLEQVKANFEKYDLLDAQVRFLKGWFKDTLPSAPIERLAILRLDGDMYESTMDGLAALYGKLSDGGFVIVDDYGAVPACVRAVWDFRKQLNIEDRMYSIGGQGSDGRGAFWRKARPF
jgi:hypothetical protein